MSLQDLLGMPSWQGDGRDTLRQKMYDAMYHLIMEKYKEGEAGNENYSSFSFQPTYEVKVVFCVDKPGVQPHWYYVGFGLSRSANDAVWIRPKSEPIEDDDEYGIEFSFRLARQPGESTNPSDCPKWPFDIMQMFGVGHHSAFPCALDPSGKLTSVVFAADPQIPLQKRTETIPGKDDEIMYGHILVLQMVGITAADHSLIRKSTGKNFLNELATTNPLWITNMNEAPLVNNADRVKRLLSIVPDIPARITDARMSVSSDKIHISAEARLGLATNLLSAFPERDVIIVNKSTDQVILRSIQVDQPSIEQRDESLVVGLTVECTDGLHKWCNAKSEKDTYTITAGDRTCVFGYSLDTTLIPLVAPNFN